MYLQGSSTFQRWTSRDGHLACEVRLQLDTSVPFGRTWVQVLALAHEASFLLVMQILGGPMRAQVVVPATSPGAVTESQASEFFGLAHSGYCGHLGEGASSYDYSSSLSLPFKQIHELKMIS